LTDAELLDRWLRGPRRRGPRYLETARNAAERFLAFVKKPLRQATFKDVQAFMDHLATRGMRPGELVMTRLRVQGLLWSLRWASTELSCPCGYGALSRASVPSRNIQVYVCDECELAWTGAGPFEMGNCSLLPEIRQKYGIDDDDFEVLH
jgi:hypothetical protein